MLSGPDPLVNALRASVCGLFSSNLSAVANVCLVHFDRHGCRIGRRFLRRKLHRSQRAIEMPLGLLRVCGDSGTCNMVSRDCCGVPGNGLKRVALRLRSRRRSGLGESL